MVAYREDRTDSQVLEQGHATSPVSGNRVVDANKRWAANQWAGHLVRFRGGIINDHAVGVIASNGVSTLYLEGLNLGVEAAGVVTSYEILAIKGGRASNGSRALEAKLDDILGVLVEIKEHLTQQG